MALFMSEPDSRPLPPLPTEGGSWELDETAWEWVRAGELISVPGTGYLVKPGVTGDEPLALPMPADHAPLLAS
jgi:hypothetical protein